ncbi:MAG: hypothetical protein ACYDCO_15950 [Armatimonadota bacterium]
MSQTLTEKQARDERVYPYIVGAVIAVGSFLILQFAFHERQFPETFKDLLGAAVNVSAISIGFLATAKSIVFSMEDRRIIRILKEANLYNVFIGYFMSAIHWSFLLSILSAAILLLGVKEPTILNRFIIAGWAFTAITMGLLCYRVIFFFSRVLMSPTDQDLGLTDMLKPDRDDLM